MKRVLLPILMLAGCEAYDLRTLGELQPGFEPGTYRWRTEASASWPIDSPRAEEARLRQLGEVMRLNPECAGGYRVLDRQATRRVDGLLGDIYDVYYTVRCG